MTNFNPINFINNLLSNYQNQTAKSDSAPSLLPSTNQPGDNLIMKRLAQPQNTAQNTALNDAVQRQAMAMNSAEKTALMKELLKLPDDLREFLSQQTAQNQNKTASELLKDTNLLMQKLNISQLSQLLGDNSKMAQQKLMQIIVEISRNQGGDIKQMKEIMAMFANNTTVSALSGEANQTLKNLILLYLPWVPLKDDKNDLVDFELDFFEEEDLTDKGGKEGAESSQSVNILIQTKNYGNINAYLQLTSPNNLTTLIYCSDNFPGQMLEKLLNEEAKDINLNSTLMVETIKSDVPKMPVEQEGQENSQKVKINVNSNINSYLLLITYSLIRLVVGIDKSTVSPN